MKPYFTVVGEAQKEILAIKGSRFIAFAAPVSDEYQAKVFIQNINMRHSDARHWCWAYQLRNNNLSRFSDDGEPSGSAGKPILAPINGRDLFDVCTVVVRYFGGVKLGVGGLVRAYSQASNAVLDVATIEKITPKVELLLKYQYGETSQLAAALAFLNIEEKNLSYTDIITSSLFVVPSGVEHVQYVICEYTSGKIEITSP